MSDPRDERVDDAASGDDRPPPDATAGGDSGTAGRAPMGLDQLQAAGQELIGALRAVLDVAEDLLSDPRTADAVGTALSSLERAANRAAAAGRKAAGSWTAGAATSASETGPEDDDGDQGPGVQHIPVS